MLVQRLQCNGFHTNTLPHVSLISLLLAKPRLLIRRTRVLRIANEAGQSEDSRYQLETMAQCISMGTWKRLTTPIHYMYISDTIWVHTRNCVNMLIHILYNFQTIWVQCISLRTQNCINTLVHFLYTFYTIWVLTDVVADVISELLSLNVNKIK